MYIDEEIRPDSNRYISEEGAVVNLLTLLSGFSHPIIITGEKSYAVFQAHTAKPLRLPVYRYDGSASDADAAHIAEQAKQADMIVAIGGGRLLDTAKLVAEIFDCEYITVPTWLRIAHRIRQSVRSIMLSAIPSTASRTFRVPLMPPWWIGTLLPPHRRII